MQNELNVQPGNGGATRNPGKPVILSKAKNLPEITEIFRFAQNDENAKKTCRTRQQSYFRGFL
jgi:hypothetical protein